MTDRKLLEQALYAMMDAMRVSGGISDKMFESFNAISERLAQPRREWQRLTDDERDAIDKSIPDDTDLWVAKRVFARAIEDKLKEKNT